MMWSMYVLLFVGGAALPLENYGNYFEKIINGRSSREVHSELEPEVIEWPIAAFRMRCNFINTFCAWKNIGNNLVFSPGGLKVVDEKTGKLQSKLISGEEKNHCMELKFLNAPKNASIKVFEKELDSSHIVLEQNLTEIELNVDVDDRTNFKIVIEITGDAILKDLALTPGTCEEVVLSRPDVIEFPIESERAKCSFSSKYLCGWRNINEGFNVTNDGLIVRRDKIGTLISPLISGQYSEHCLTINFGNVIEPFNTYIFQQAFDGIAEIYSDDTNTNETLNIDILVDTNFKIYIELSNQAQINSINLKRKFCDGDSTDLEEVSWPTVIKVEE